jgi:hypothetical protein
VPDKILTPLDIPVEELGLPVRAYTPFKYLGITTIGQLLTYSGLPTLTAPSTLHGRLMQIPRLGEKTVREIEAAVSVALFHGSVEDRIKERQRREMLLKVRQESSRNWPRYEKVWLARREGKTFREIGEMIDPPISATRAREMFIRFDRGLKYWRWKKIKDPDSFEAVWKDRGLTVDPCEQEPPI